MASKVEGGLVSAVKTQGEMVLEWAGSEEMTATKQTHRTVGFAGRSFVSAKKHEGTEREAGALRREVPQKARIGGFLLCCGVCAVCVLAFGAFRRWRRNRKPSTTVGS